MSGDPTYPLFPIAAFFSTFLVLLPLPWHLQAWNAGTCLYMFWTAIGCFCAAVSSVIWRNDAIDRAPIWCDITTRITTGLAVGIPAASLCINRRLYKIATTNSVGISRREKRNALLCDLAIGLGIPLLEMPLVFIVQGHRYDIYEGVGCHLQVYNTPPAYPLVFLWPIVIGIVSAIYCVLTLRAFLRRRAEFSQFLSSQPSSLNAGRYFRLMALATTELVFTLPLSAYGLYLNSTVFTIQPWISWEDTHFDYFVIGQFPAVLWRATASAEIPLELGRWLLVFCALLFFAFFGFAEEARKSYKSMLRKVLGWCGIHPSRSFPTTAKGAWKGLSSNAKESSKPNGQRVIDIFSKYPPKRSFSSSTIVAPSSPSPAYDPKDYFSSVKTPTSFPSSPRTPPRHDLPTPSSMKTSFDVDLEGWRSNHTVEPVPPLPTILNRTTRQPPPALTASPAQLTGQWLYHFDSPTSSTHFESQSPASSPTPRDSSESRLSPPPRRYRTRKSDRPLSSPF